MFIEFGTWNFKLFILLFYPIGNLILAKLPISNSTFNNYFLIYFSFLSSGIIYLFTLFRSRGKNETEISFCASKGSAINQIEKKRKEEKKKKKIKEKISIFLLALLYYFQDWIDLFFGENIYYYMDKICSIEIAKLSIFYFCILFSKLILHEKIYKHRVTSIIITSICSLILIIMGGLFTYKIVSFLVLLTIIFSRLGINALFFVLAKKHFNIYLTDLYLFIFYLGLFSFISYIPLEIIYYFFFGGNNEYLGEGIIFQILSNPGEFLKNLLYFFLLIPLCLFTHGSPILILYYFTPCHFIISLMPYLTLTVIIGKIDNYELIYKIIFIIVNIIMFTFTLVYNEIIIIKLCSLQKSTAKYISIREGKNEYVNLYKAYNDNEDENEDEEFNSRVSINSIIECENVFDQKSKNYTTL